MVLFFFFALCLYVYIDKSFLLILNLKAKTGKNAIKQRFVPIAKKMKKPPF